MFKEEGDDEADAEEGGEDFEKGLEREGGRKVSEETSDAREDRNSVELELTVMARENS